MTSPIASIDSVLSQMRQVANVATAKPVQPASIGAPQGPSGGFAAEFQAAIKNVTAAQKHASTQARHFELGVPGVSLNDVMIDMQKSSIGFQSIVQVRNKLVSAYQTIASMPL